MFDLELFNDGLNKSRNSLGSLVYNNFSRNAIMDEDLFIKKSTTACFVSFQKSFASTLLIT